jgi:hypothetical protein
MSQHIRDLRNAGLYLVALVAVAAGLLACGALLSQRVGAHTFVRAMASLIELDEPEPPTRLSIAIENAREIRAALAKPVLGPDPLPPVTAKLAHGQLKSGRAAARPHALKLPQEAMDAMASAGHAAVRPAPPRVELHKVY